ncbi:Cytochrome c, mono-and diheme variants [Gemmobacter aquatilis]|uniref:Cytochrome c, mono-and diheme variants n=1 Tax=Gemmobacter aquatilis TaxID=933059 RepID=A0A1H8CUW6_9RHOB|nr:cytochrome c [Gemmobacter aquatilis]SEM98913.1 Cytochrome c, mono-and diheme variants [Gemmobacter aquatilis]
MSRAKLLLLACLIPLAACRLPAQDVPSGAEDFASFCAACHGEGGKGDGSVAETLEKRPADLTRLSQKNHGKFPMTRVMSKIWGYAKAPDGTVMPQFAPLLDHDQIVLFDSGDGIATPTPLRLVQLAEYLKTIQE